MSGEARERLSTENRKRTRGSDRRARASPGTAAEYEEYHWDKLEFLRYFSLYLGMSVWISWLFYRDIRGALIIGAVMLPLGIKRKKCELLRKKKQKLALEFTDCIRMVSGNLAAGYSMENAWQNVAEDFAKLHGRSADMYRELMRLNAGLRVNESVENLLLDFSARSGLRDVDNFCRVFSFAKRSGGNLVKIIENTVKQIGEKQEVMREIETVLAAKRLEQKVMNFIPMVILAYVGVSSPEFLAPLYQNPPGILVMSICLAVYGIAFLLSDKIVRIEV